MFTGKVSELTKEQRREISAYINNVTRFVQTARSIKNEKLVGRNKRISQIVGWTLIVGFFALFILATEGYYVDLGVFNIVYLFIYPFIGWLLYEKVNLWLKFLQVKDRAKKLGFGL